MATSTTKLGLTKPAGSDAVDVAVLNANSDKIDAAISITVCTSTTRPSTPFDGQKIYETDTRNEYVYRISNTTWNPITVPRGSATPFPSSQTGDVFVNTTQKALNIYDGSTWEQATTPVVADAATRNAAFPSPVVGNSVYRSDLGRIERYYAATGSPARPAGWYSGQDGGLVPIIPTSVDISAGSSTVTGNGIVAFSNTAYVRLNGVFSSAYANYKLIAYGVNVTTGTSMTGRFSVGGVDNTASVYNYQGTNQVGTGAVTNWQFTASSLYFGNGAGDGLLTYDISNPAVAARTKLNGQTAGYTSANGAWALSMMHDSSTVFDGFTLFCGTGTFNGVIRIYGYN